MLLNQSDDHSLSITRDTLADRAADLLRKQILVGDLKPNEILGNIMLPSIALALCRPGGLNDALLCKNSILGSWSCYGRKMGRPQACH